MKKYERVKVQFHKFLTSVVDGRERLPHALAFRPEKIPRHS
jgi:hypothetical protein